MADDDAMAFDFEEQLDAVEPGAGAPADNANTQLALITAEDAEAAQPKEKNYRQTVCAFWLRGMCMKGDSCGFLHKFDPGRMPVCRVWMKTGECKELECPFKHSLEDVKECNMYKLGFCIYGPHCRYKHTKQPGPPPNPDDVEAAKPREFRDWRKIMADDKPHDTQQQQQQHGRRQQRDGNREQTLALPAPQQQQQQNQQQQQQQQPVLALPGPPGMSGQQQQHNPLQQQQQQGMPSNPVDMQQHLMAGGMGLMAPGMMPGLPGQNPMGAGFMGPPGGGYPGMPGMAGMGGMPSQQAMMAAQAAMMMQQMGMGPGMMPQGGAQMMPPAPPGRGPRPPHPAGMNGW